MRRFRFLRVLICLSFVSAGLAGCSLYESAGRKIIETNENNIVGAYGFNSRHTLKYKCIGSRQVPEFMRAPMEVVSTPYEAENMTVLIDIHATPVFLAIEKTVAPNVYLSCSVKFLETGITGQTLSSKEILNAARLGRDQIVGMMTSMKMQH